MRRSGLHVRLPRPAGSDARANRFAFRAAYERLPLDQDVVLVRFNNGDTALLHAKELGQPAYALAPIRRRDGR